MRNQTWKRTYKGKRVPERYPGIAEKKQTLSPSEGEREGREVLPFQQPISKMIILG
jgi:hypothetical protein